MAGTPTIQVGTSEQAKITVYSSPRERFQSNPANIRAHQDMVDQPSFERAADAVLAQLCENWADKVQDSTTAMAYGYEMRGAVTFLKMFKQLGETPKAKPKMSNPDHLTPTDKPRRP